MPKYIKIRSSWAEDENHYDPPMLLPHLIVDESVGTFSGLLDKDGDELWHFPNAIGFEKELWD